MLRHVAKGLGNKEIAQAIGRSAETVKAHLESIFQKLGAKDRTHAVTIALQRGIIHLDGVTPNCPIPASLVVARHDQSDCSRRTRPYHRYG